MHWGLIRRLGGQHFLISEAGKTDAGVLMFILFKKSDISSTYRGIPIVGHDKMRSGADSRGGSPLVSFDHVIDPHFVTFSSSLYTTISNPNPKTLTLILTLTLTIFLTLTLTLTVTVG